MYENEGVSTHAEEDEATMPTSHHDYHPNGVRDDPAGIYIHPVDS
jgi:hypothetical protein